MPNNVQNNVQVIRDIQAMRETIARWRAAKAAGQARVTIGFVPTMGYLHEGHMSLIEAAAEQCDYVVLSIYVNPLQFGPQEDFATYPRDLERDVAIAAKLGVDAVFAPHDQEMYPHRPNITVKVSDISDVLCGATRPGHFDGVATVVMKLLNIVAPDRVYFGLKDAQQVAVINQMVRDLNLNIEVNACPTLREEDGLAMSSRNVYLSAEERKQAVVLYEALQLAERLMADDAQVTAGQLQQRLEQHIRTAPLAVIDYVSIVQYPELTVLPSDARLGEWRQAGSLMVALAVKFGKTRLIDNRIIGGEDDVQNDDEI